MSNLCNTEDLLSLEYKTFCTDIKVTPIFNRKYWEWFTIYNKIIKHFNNSLKEKKGLGFATGGSVKNGSNTPMEPLVELFMKYGANITATDIDISPDMDLNDLDLKGIVEKDIFFRSIKVDHIDMNNISDGYLKPQFDFIWSSCAIEHLGSIKLGLDFVKNSLSCLKSGGIAIHTTEYNVNSNTEHCDHIHSCIYSQTDILNFKNDVESLGYIVRPINFTRENNSINNYVDNPWEDGYCLGNSVELWNEILLNPHKRAHINLLLHENESKSFVSTSIYFAIIKP